MILYPYHSNYFNDQDTCCPLEIHVFWRRTVFTPEPNRSDRLKARTQLRTTDADLRCRYCSTSCQKKDWNDSDLKPFGGNHQKLCRKLVAANKLNPLNSQNRPYEPRTWGEYRLETVR